MSSCPGCITFRSGVWLDLCELHLEFHSGATADPALAVPSGLLWSQHEFLLSPGERSPCSQERRAQHHCSGALERWLSIRPVQLLSLYLSGLSRELYGYFQRKYICEESCPTNFHKVKTLCPGVTIQNSFISSLSVVRSWCALQNELPVSTAAALNW